MRRRGRTCCPKLRPARYVATVWICTGEDRGGGVMYRPFALCCPQTYSGDPCGGAPSPSPPSGVAGPAPPIDHWLCHIGVPPKPTCVWVAGRRGGYAVLALKHCLVYGMLCCTTPSQSELVPFKTARAPPARRRRCCTTLTVILCHPIPLPAPALTNSWSS